MPVRVAYPLRAALDGAVLEARLHIRRLQPMRMAPSVFVIGAQKAGTTTLHGHLSRHPQILPPLVKEAHYFDRAIASDTRGYLANFPTQARADAAALTRGTRVLTFDATPYYFFHPAVAARVRAFAPEARIIALLRDPVARAWSHYWHEYARGYEQLPPAEAFAAEPDRVPAPHDRIGDTAEDRFAHQHYGYCARSEYDRQVGRWQDLFPLSQLLFLKSEELFAHPDAVLDRVTDFLAIDRVSSRPTRALNVGAYEPPSDDLVIWLKARLAPSTARTAALLGPTFSWR